MAKILLFDRNEQYIATLKGVLSAKHTEELNGENVLEIETLDEIEKNQRLIYKDKYGYWHEFIVRGVEEERTEAGIIRRVFAEHSFYETWGDYIEDKRPYDVPANIALSVALEPTRWEVGIVDDLGINSTNFYHISAKEAVQKVAETWQGELRYRGRYVDLLARRGYDLGKRFTYTKDLLSITKTVHRDDVITALYGYGKGEEITDDDGNATGGYGRRIDFSGINGGKAYVEDNDAKEIWGRLNPDGTRSHVFSKAEFDDCEDPLELLELTTAKLEELSKPLITYNATVVDLKAFGIEHEGVALGDTVGIIDREFKPELRLKARVIKMVRDLLEPENTEIVLGNFMPTIVDSWLEQEKYISNFRDKQGVWDRSKIIDSDGTINAQFLNDLVAEMNRRMNAQGGYVYISDQGEGLITYDRPDPEEATMAIQLLGGSFRISNSKLPNGEWNWRTFGDGNGFVADAFIGGLLKGGKVHFDLTNGTLLIGNSIEDYRLFFDGNNLSIRLSHGKTIEESIEDVDQNISDSQEYLRGEIDEVNAKVDDVIGLVGEESVANIKQQLQDAFDRELEAINKALYGDDQEEEGILERLAALTGDTAGLYIDLVDQSALIESLTGKISIEGDTVLIGDVNASKGIRIKSDEIAFLEGSSKVAWITGGMLYIDAGVFLTRLKIGNHVFQSVDGNPDITIVGYEP